MVGATVGASAVNVLGTAIAAVGALSFASLEWWQGLVLVLGGLGLSPAPWILGLAMGRIQFTAVAAAAHERELEKQEHNHAAQMDALREFHVQVLAAERERYKTLEKANEQNREAAERNQQRADQLTDAAFSLAEIIQANSHVIGAVNKVTEKVITGDRT